MVLRTPTIQGRVGSTNKEQVGTGSLSRVFLALWHIEPQAGNLRERVVREEILGRLVVSDLTLHFRT